MPDLFCASNSQFNVVSLNYDQMLNDISQMWLWCFLSPVRLMIISSNYCTCWHVSALSCWLLLGIVPSLYSHHPMKWDIWPQIRVSLKSYLSFRATVGTSWGFCSDYIEYNFLVCPFQLDFLPSPPGFDPKTTLSSCIHFIHLISGSASQEI